MRRSVLRRALVELTADVSGVDVDLDRMLEAIEQACGTGYPPSTLGGGYGATNSVTSMVERQAFGRDQAALDRARFAQLVMWAHAAMVEADTIRRAYTAPPRKGSARRKGAGDLGCEMMASIGEFEPGRLTDVAGALPHKRRLGRWAADFVARAGRLPTREEIERHARGGKVHAS